MNQDIEKKHSEEKTSVENDLFSLGPIHSTPAESKVEESDSTLFPASSEETPPTAPVEENAAPVQTEKPVAEEQKPSSHETAPETVLPAEEKSSFRTFPEKTAREMEGDSVATPPPPPVKRRSLRSGIGASLGALLAEARSSAGLSLEKVSEETRIRISHINALENDNFSALPSPVYIKAYVRTLVNLYNLDNKAMDLIDEHLQELESPKDVPEKLLEDLGKDVQISKDEAKKVRMILIYAGVILLLLISLTVTSIVAVNIRSSRNHQRQTPIELRPFESKQLEKLLPQQIPETKMLKVPPPK